MGECDGVHVGANVGAGEGVSVGALVGVLVGARVGNGVGGGVVQYTSVAPLCAAALGLNLSLRGSGAALCATKRILRLAEVITQPRCTWS